MNSLAKKKGLVILFTICVLSMIVSNFVFAGDIAESDKIYDTALKVLISIQRYSWPVAALVFIYALYEFYVIGSEMLERKVAGERLITGIAIFMAIVQCLPLIYAIATVGS